MGLYKYLLLVLNVVALTLFFHMTWENRTHDKANANILSLYRDQFAKDISSQRLESTTVQPEVSGLTAFPTSSARNFTRFIDPSDEEKPETSTELVKSYDTIHKVLEEHTAVISRAFADHPSHRISPKGRKTLEDYMLFLALRPACEAKPIFLTMARVSSPLYWQLIENFFYTMNYFGHLECAVMVCVSDDTCVSKCASQNFPCFDYRYENPEAVTFEQVAAIKLKHVALALEKGVNVLLLDLDVGFLRDPLTLFQGFLEHDDIQVRTQMDIGWAMDKKQGMTWFTFPRANFGIFLVKACPLSSLVFNRAWKKYQELTPAKKAKVASDQSVMQGALSYGRWRFQYNFSYFYPGFLPDTYPRQVDFTPTLLLHKVENYNSNGIRYELGGIAAQEEIGNAVAVHATCYEKTTKVDGLKIANAFWDEHYYTPTKRTLTKPLMLHTSMEDLLEEVQALAFLALSSNRSLIIPNILIGIGLDLPGGKASKRPLFDYRLNAKNPKLGRLYPRISARSDLKNMPMSHCAKFGQNYYWPAFRSVFSTSTELEILEPSFYFKIEEHLNLNSPGPEIIQWDMSRSRGPDALEDILNAIHAQAEVPRLVLDIFDLAAVPGVGRPWDMTLWARHSTSSWGGPAIKKESGYVHVPSLPALGSVSVPKKRQLGRRIRDSIKLSSRVWRQDLLKYHNGFVDNLELPTQSAVQILFIGQSVLTKISVDCEDLIPPLPVPRELRINPWVLVDALTLCQGGSQVRQ